jgi:hypothetical protein
VVTELVLAVLRAALVQIYNLVSTICPLNCYFWLDPVKKVTGTLFTQVLPFYDERVVALYGAVERGLTAGLA